MKKLLAIALTGSLAFSLIACGSSKPLNSGKGEKEKDEAKEEVIEETSPPAQEETTTEVSDDESEKTEDTETVEIDVDLPAE